jgi:hypothetical protein
MGRGFRWWLSSSAAQPDRSAGRYPDGNDSDSNCSDFLLQNTTTLLAASAAGSDNIKVASVEEFTTGQKLFIGTGTDRETAVVAIVGTAGGTTLGASTGAGTTVIPVAGVEGFSAGQTITLDNDANLETAVVASITAGHRRFGRTDNSTSDSITVTMPLKLEHAAGAQVSGSGITLATPLTVAHDNGTQVAGNVPTPGEPNRYRRKP